jgi:hypothetical protein
MVQSGIICGILMFLVFIKVASKYWMIPVISLCVFTFYYKPGNTIAFHGSINAILFTLTLVLTIVACFILKLMNKLLLIKEFYIAFAIIALVMIFGTVYFRLIYNNCEGFNDGLGGHKLINDDKHCVTPMPNF